MKMNTGKADRYVRFLTGVAFLLNIIILEPGVIGTIILLALGCSMLFSAFSGFCFMYDILKIKSCKETCAITEEKAS
jgi:hypothetical protein